MRLPWAIGLAASGSRQHVERGNPGEVLDEPPVSRRFTIDHLPLAMARIDPIGSPGQVASQTYTIYGASNFRSYLNRPEEQSRATCTTSGPQADKSNYWVPTLYWKYDDGTLEPLQNKMIAHYFGNSDASDTPYTTPFPRGMRIRVGTPTSRHTPDIRKLYIEMNCKSQGKHVKTTPFLPNGDNSPSGCDGGLTITVHFPSCGLANQSLDSDDHFQHLTWPIRTGGGRAFMTPLGLRCPPTHPIKYPSFHLEIVYDLNDRMKSSGWGTERLILSNGDTVGTSFHANFVSGWDEDVLRDTMNTCRSHDCPALAKSFRSQSGGACMHEGMQPDENVGLLEPISQLPGSNCLWSADMGDDKPDCPRTTTPGWTFPNLLWANRGRGNSLLIPARLSVDQDMSETALTAQYYPKAAGTNPTFRACSEADGNERMEIFFNRANIRCGSNQDIQDNLDMASAANKIDSVPAMQDTREYRNWVRCNPVGEEAWRVFPASQWPKSSCWAASGHPDDHDCIWTDDKARE